MESEEKCKENIDKRKDERKMTSVVFKSDDWKSQYRKSIKNMLKKSKMQKTNQKEGIVK